MKWQNIVRNKIAKDYLKCNGKYCLKLNNERLFESTFARSRPTEQE